jgi:hypothetical protein
MGKRKSIKSINDTRFNNWYNELANRRGWTSKWNDKEQAYDYKTFFNDNPIQAAIMLYDSPTAHFPDTYKLPNHPTFSKYSMYSNDETPGGDWVTRLGINYYIPSEYTKQNINATRDYLRNTGEGYVDENGYNLDMNENSYKYGGRRSLKCGGNERPKAFWGAVIGAVASLASSLIGASSSSSAAKKQYALNQKQVNAQEAASATQAYQGNYDLQNEYENQFNKVARYGTMKKIDGNSKSDGKATITDGGKAIRVGRGLSLLRGRTHEQLGSDGKTGIGIKVGNNEIEAENNEAAFTKNGNLYILSAQPMINGYSPSELAVNGIVDKNTAYNLQEQAKNGAKVTRSLRCGGKIRRKAEEGDEVLGTKFNPTARIDFTEAVPGLAEYKKYIEDSNKVNPITTYGISSVLNEDALNNEKNYRNTLYNIVKEEEDLRQKHEDEARASYGDETVTMMINGTPTTMSKDFIDKTIYNAGKYGYDPYWAMAIPGQESSYGTAVSEANPAAFFNAHDYWQNSPVFGNYKVNEPYADLMWHAALLVKHPKYYSRLKDNELNSEYKDVFNNKYVGQYYGNEGNRDIKALNRDVKYFREVSDKDYYKAKDIYDWIFRREASGKYNPLEPNNSIGDRKAKIQNRIKELKNSKDFINFMNNEGNEIYQRGVEEYNRRQAEKRNTKAFGGMTNRRTLKNGGSLYASPVEDSANKIENLPIYLRRVARLGGSFTTNQQNNSMRQNANKRAKFWDGGDTSNLIAGLSSLAGSAIQGITYSKMKSPTMPRLYRPQSFKLNYNVAPQLAEVERARQLSTDYTRRNTVSSATATDRVNTINMNAATEANKLWQTKENQETEMFNKNAEQMNIYGAKNVEAMNNYYNALTEFNNNKIAGIASSINGGLSAIGNFATKYAENQETQNSNTINLMSSLMAANPETVSYALGNDEFRKALAKSANINVNALTQLLVDINRKKGNNPTIDTTTITSPSESQETPTSITGTSTNITGTPMTTRWLNYKSRILRKPNTSINTTSNDSALNSLLYPRKYSLLYTPYSIG